MGISDGDDPLNQKEMLEELMSNCKLLSEDSFSVAGKDISEDKCSLTISFGSPVVMWQFLDHAGMLEKYKVYKVDSLDGKKVKHNFTLDRPDSRPESRRLVKSVTYYE
tara:strand:- start:17085 stop:17408 length:324 start_codon:yes stop_codon:yes gene_type:complete